MLRVGIAGAGFMGEVHAEAYKRISGAEIFAIAETNEDKRTGFVQKFKPRKAFSTVEEMVQDKEIDLVDICLPTPLHSNAAISALEQNKHVLLEKPIALTVAEALQIKEAAQKSEGKFMVAHVLRFWPEYELIKSLLSGDKIGKIREIYAARFNELPLWSEGTWLMNEELSGGLAIDLMIHDIDFLVWNFGRVTDVMATAIKNEQNFSLQIMATLKFEGGETAYIEGAYLNPSGRGLTTEFKAYGERGLLELYPNMNDLKVTMAKAQEEHFKIPSGDGYYNEIAYFVTCVSEDKTPDIITVDEAIESLKVALAIRESVAQRKWLAL